MQANPPPDGASEPGYVSTGHLPRHELVANLVAEAHSRFRSNADGKNSNVYPALERVPSDLFGVCVVATSGGVAAAGDTDYEFSIMASTIVSLSAILQRTSLAPWKISIGFLMRSTLWIGERSASRARPCGVRGSP